MTDGQLLVGQTGADPLPKTIGTDITIAASGAATIANNAVTLAKLATYPLDTVKKRQQVGGRVVHWVPTAWTGGAVPPLTMRAYGGILNAALCIVREAGLAGLDRGTVPSLLKAGLGGAVSFWCYKATLTALESVH